MEQKSLNYETDPLGPFSALPIEILVRIANMLETEDQLSLARVNSSFNPVIKQHCLQKYARRVTAKKLSKVRDSMHSLKAFRNDPSGEHNERCYSVWTLCLIFCSLIAVPTLFTFFFYSELVSQREKVVFSLLYNISCIRFYNNSSFNCSSEITESKFGQICQIGSIQDFIEIFPLTTSSTSGWLSFGVFGIAVSTYFLHTILLFWLFYPTVNHWLERKFRRSNLWKNYQNLQLELQMLDGRNNYTPLDEDNIPLFRGSIGMLILTFLLTYFVPFLFSYFTLSVGLSSSYKNSLDPQKGNFGFQTDTYECNPEIYFVFGSNITKILGATEYIASQKLPLRSDKLSLFGALSSIGMLFVCLIPFWYILQWIRSYKKRLELLSWKNIM